MAPNPTDTFQALPNQQQQRINSDFALAVRLMQQAEQRRNSIDTALDTARQNDTPTGDLPKHITNAGEAFQSAWSALLTGTDRPNLSRIDDSNIPDIAAGILIRNPNLPERVHHHLGTFQTHAKTVVTDLQMGHPDSNALTARITTDADLMVCAVTGARENLVAAGEAHPECNP